MSDQVRLTIDGVEVMVPRGTMVVDAAKRAGIDIPVFCHHPKLQPVGMCRMCLVRVGRPMRDRATGQLVLEEDGSPKINWGRGLPETGCTVEVSEGMVVDTQSQAVSEGRRAIIEFLLTSHPLDCPVCDKGGECPLQNQTMAYGNGQSRFIFSNKIKLAKNVPLGDLITLDRERCIQCARCIRFQDEVVDDPVIAFHNRGRRLEIVTQSEPGFDSIWSGNSTDICPVGALTTEDFRFGARPWELTPVASICPHCPVGCNTTLSTRREAKSGGRPVIKRIMPRQNEQVNEIWLCDKGRFVHHFAGHEERLATPLVRREGQLVPASWEEALSLAAAGLQQQRGHVAGLAGDRLSNEDLFTFQKVMRQGLGSPHLDVPGRRLGGADVVAQVGLAAGSNLAELGRGDAILVVASDLHEEAPLWWLRVKQAAQRGASLVLLNLRPTRLDKWASLAIHYAPGAALSTVRRLVNATKVTDVPAGDAVQQAAQILANAGNLVAFYGGEGLAPAQSESLARLLGNLFLLQNGDGPRAGRHNNGLVPVWRHGNSQGAWDMGLRPDAGPGYTPLDQPGLDAGGILAGCATGQIQALYVAGTDPVGDGLLAGRGQLAFLVVQELFLTETARLADVVLPAQSWAEREGSYTSGERRVQRFYPALAPLGQCRPDWQISAQLGEKLGLEKGPFSASLLFKELAAAVGQYAGMDYRTLSAVTPQWPRVGGPDLYYGGTAYDNRSGLGQPWPVAAQSGPVAHFTAGLDGPDGEEGVAGGRLAVVPVAALYTPGTLIEKSALLAARLARPECWLNPADASALGLATGDRLGLQANGRSVPATARITAEVAPGLALVRGVPALAGNATLSLAPLSPKKEAV